MRSGLELIYEVLFLRERCMCFGGLEISLGELNKC